MSYVIQGYDAGTAAKVAATYYISAQEINKMISNVDLGVRKNAVDYRIIMKRKGIQS